MHFSTELKRFVQHFLLTVLRNLLSSSIKILHVVRDKLNKEKDWNSFCSCDDKMKNKIKSVAQLLLHNRERLFLASLEFLFRLRARSKYWKQYTKHEKPIIEWWWSYCKALSTTAVMQRNVCCLSKTVWVKIIESISKSTDNT